MELTPQLLARYDKPGPRYTSYPTALEFTEDLGPQAYLQALNALAQGGQGRDIALYLHLPFCAQRCLYCACNAIVSPKRRFAERYLKAILREAELTTQALGYRPKVSQLHLGGGTPTFYSAAELNQLIAGLKARFELQPGAELAIELDPRVTTQAHLDTLKAQGFNRLSLGIQDFDPLVQQAVQRIQAEDDIRQLLAAARQMGFGSINFDLMYGLPHQSPERFGATLDKVIELRPERLAVYSFAWVPWLKAHQKKLPQDALPSPETKLELRALTSQALSAAGYVTIGMDHYALPEDELTLAQQEGRLRRNFMGYSTVQAEDILGLGLSAIGLVADTYVQNQRKLHPYLEAIEAGSLAAERGCALSPEDRLRAYVIRELMCNFTLAVEAVEERFEIDFASHFAAERAALEALQEQGMIELSPSHLKLTELGQVFVRNVAMVFDTYLAKHQQGQAFSRTV